MERVKRFFVLCMKFLCRLRLRSHAFRLLAGGGTGAMGTVSAVSSIVTIRLKILLIERMIIFLFLSLPM